MGLTRFLTLFFLLSFHTSSLISANLDTYIVHVESPDESDHAQLTTSTDQSGLTTHEDLDKWYHSFLPLLSATAASDTDEEAPRMVYCYHNVFKGFAARLSPEHVKEMEKKAGFVSAAPQKVLSLHTTHTPNFLGINQNVGLGFWKKSNYGKGVIIGIVDTGIFPDHPSFSDKGMAPPPAKWKGKCDFKPPFSCNKKLIGARYFNQGDTTPMDENGHGTHTAATAAGNFVAGANVFGNANGTAAGIAPLAHVAMYKVCGASGGCNDADILTAMDVAIDDGVDVLSISLGGGSEPYYSDDVALGAYSAVQRGIFVSCSAGNSGPFSSSLSNDAPWILTVGASSTDRKIRATAVLGNKVQLHGESAYQPESFAPKQYPLFYPGLNESDYEADKYCSANLVDFKAVRGKIVVCEIGNYEALEKGENVLAAGCVGMILINQAENGDTTYANAHVLPATHLNYEDRGKLIAYMNSTRSPTAAISFQGTLIGDPHAPQIGSFSSRGPSIQTRGILKPDIIGPGVNILAGWHVSLENRTNNKAYFNVISGTSMSCPHLSGVAALLKSAHPYWSPAVIKSAIMTTADLLNLGKTPIQDEKRVTASFFSTGSGHVNPTKADNPGLVYDIEPKDYLSFLCGQNYTDRQLGNFVQRKTKCTTRIPATQLNYPSFAIEFGEKIQNYTRKVTNVGEAVSVYAVKVVPPSGSKVTVRPQKLSFSKINQRLTYEVTFELVKFPQDTFGAEGSITWTSQSHSVRIPIVATERSVTSS